MKSTNSEIDSRIGKRKWMKGKILSRAVTLALALGLSGFFYVPTHAATVTDTTENGGVAVKMSDDTKKASAKGEASIAEGEDAVANATGGIAIGRGALAGDEPAYGYSKVGSIAIGDGAKAKYNYSVVIGAGAESTNKNTVAAGYKSKTSSLESVAIGFDSNSNGTGSVALGSYTYVKDKYSVALGNMSSAEGEAIDGTSKFTGTAIKQSQGVISVGTKDREYDDNGTKKNTGVITRRIVNVAGGINDTDAVNVAQLTAVANKIGNGNQYISIKPGDSKTVAKATGTNSIAIGDGAKSDSNKTIVIGANAEAMKYTYTNDAGKQFDQTSARSISIGNNSKVKDTDAVALGYGAQALYNYSVAIGSGALADKGSSVVIGGASKVLAQDAIAIGRSVKVTAEADDGVAIGYGAKLGYAKFDDSRIADKYSVDLKTEFEQLQKTPTILTQNQQYGSFSSIEGGGSSDDKPSVPTDNNGKPKAEITRGAITIGHWSAASGYHAVSIGATSRSYGMNAVALGASSKAFLDSTVAIGDMALATKARSTAIGDMAMAEASDSIAMGTYARVTDKNSVSLGKFSSTQGTALDKDTKAAFSDETVSKDAGVVSVGTKAYTEDFVTGRIGDKEGDKYALTTKKRNIPEMKRRIVNVAGGINDNDAVNVKQLTAVADSPVYFYSGGTADSNKVSGNYNIRNIRLAFTDGLKAETDTEGGNSIVKVGLDKTYMDQINKAVKDAQDSATAAKGSQDEAKKSADAAAGSATDAGNAKTDAEAAKDEAVKAKTDAETAKTAAETAKSAAENSAGEAKESANNAATSEKNAKDAADKAQEYADKAQKLVESNGAGNVNGHDGSTAIGKDSGVDSDNGTVIGQGASVGKDADGGTAIGQGAKVEEGAENSVAIGKDSVADKPNTVSVGSKGNERTITNVAPGRIEEGSTDAVNGGQLYDVSQRVGDNTRAISNLQDESRKGDAMNAALAALKPIGYNPAEPAQIMAGVGTYRGQQAIALGAAYYIDGSTMVNGGLAYAGDNHLMANAGVTWRIGSGSVPAEKVSSAGEVKALNERVQVLEATVEEQKKQIEELIALLQKK